MTTTPLKVPDRIDAQIVALGKHWPDARIQRFPTPTGRDLIEVAFSASWWRLTPDGVDEITTKHHHEDGVQGILNRLAVERSSNV